MAVEVGKEISAALLFAVAVVGAFGALRVSRLSSIWVQTCNAFAGGTMVSVAIVHILSDSTGDMSDTGKAITKALGGDDDDEFPIGNTLFLIGFLICFGIHALAGYYAGGHTHDGATDLEKDSGHIQTQALSAPEVRRRSTVSPVSSVAASLGLALHSSVEAVAIGTQEGATLVLITLAVAMHKGFAAFALATALLPLRDQGRVGTWWLIVMAWCLTAPVGIAIGAAAESGLDGQGVAALNCLAAGSLLFVGVVDMLVPAFEGNEKVRRKLLAAVISSVMMSLLAVWA